MNHIISTVVVTFNRKPLLRQALAAHAVQTHQGSQLLIVDNASTDGTRDMLASEGWLGRSSVELLALPENTGGAGGFAAGLKYAIDKGAEWVWMMDDDAEPHPTALEELMQVANDPMQVYGSLAVNGADTSWLTTVLSPPLGEVEKAEDVPARATVQSLPFLGFLIHRKLVERIGLPDTDYFIAADDVEYCVRAQKAGADIIIAGKSRIKHPKSRPYKVEILGRTLTCLALPPWKRYYDTRNRLLIARTHYGVRLFTQTIPGSFVRLFAALLKEPHKLAQAHAFFAGFIDGFLGIKGKRHTFWRIG
ncbi:glycosyltransferase [Comamonas piscis]|uniref:Glycosyltransferase n=1 Tax=Comamonas piscis TaxID=1562974 RepID=A0A7G5EDE2_9BURK|nr:glycosyltransferase [Comamonas piscis]QMV72017.1 glycosyltransferase [Comamonas piscis]WSO34762.1 glycosyltransferase [Comamonas piscis]